MKHPRQSSVEGVQRQQQAGDQGHPPVIEQPPDQPIDRRHPQAGQHHRGQASGGDEARVQRVGLDRQHVVEQRAGRAVGQVAQEDAQASRPHGGDAGVSGAEGAGQSHRLLEAGVVGR